MSRCPAGYDIEVQVRFFLEALNAEYFVCTHAIYSYMRATPLCDVWRKEQRLYYILFSPEEIWVFVCETVFAQKATDLAKQHFDMRYALIFLSNYNRRLPRRLSPRSNRSQLTKAPLIQQQSAWSETQRFKRFQPWQLEKIVEALTKLRD